MSETSKAAYRSIKRCSGTIREQLFAYIEQEGLNGTTDDEMEVVFGYRHQTVSARRRELVQAERIVDSGNTRETRSGRQAIIWVKIV